MLVKYYWMPQCKCLTGFQFLRQLAEFRQFGADFDHFWDQCKSGEKKIAWGGGEVGVTQEILVVQKWFTYQNLQDFTRKTARLISKKKNAKKKKESLHKTLVNKLVKKA